MSSTVCHTAAAPTSPGLLVSTSKNLYIVFESSDDTNNFKLSWKAVTVSCCSSITVSSTKTEVLNDVLQKDMLGTYTNTAGDDINGSPIYKKDGKQWFAVKTVPSGFVPGWVGSLFQFGNY